MTWQPELEHILAFRAGYDARADNLPRRAPAEFGKVRFRWLEGWEAMDEEIKSYQTTKESEEQGNG